ncbi:hypothetical protein SAMN05443245_3418 [Paraburkholderia fungorum]|uniref:Uncharacterized protein n=1 Tax=Paraburkholderia fungorum TaxID=134537 RepID=A0A1H1GZZ9_9BURK|nr:hypothetical protein [Paraburkholderia fungorum]SDR18815.1 hypothetical protein SAMN05443245_3418 [Paraburkholderia fungorum]
MSEIKFNTARTNTQTHRAVLGVDDIKRILAREVCAAAAVPMGADSTRVNVQLSSRMGNCGSEYEAVVTVTIDFEKLPNVIGASE